MTEARLPDDRAGRRAQFEASRPFPLDAFQRRALDAIDDGQSVVVAAPTGSGKTLVAEYAIATALDDGGKAFYTTPLKALSNQKFGDLTRAHGAERVGLLTGDNSINGNAPVVVMTTEVLRNMIYARSSTLGGLRFVVLDEVHYLQDPYRGAVWEEVIIHLPPDVRVVCLSATVSNAEEFAAWVETVRGGTAAVIEERRPVRLEHLYLVGERGSDRVHLLPTFVPRDGEVRPNPEAARLDSVGGRSTGGRGRPRRRLRTPRRVEITEVLSDRRMLPAITFVFSRAGCDQAVEQCVAGGLRLTDAVERPEIRRIAEAHTDALTDEDLEVLHYGEWVTGLEAGLAAHHAGMVPPMKEAVEEAFAAGLVKMVFATETLSLGINMPARSVVIEKLSKFTGEAHEFLTPGEYTQLTGRAGRRGIDDVGYAVVCWSPFVPFDQVAALASRRTYALRSSFRPTYNMAANLVQRYPADVAHHLLNLSFAQFQTDRDVVGLERQLERSREQLARHRETSRRGPGDVDEYRQLASALDAERRTRGGARRTADALERLRPGDVLVRGGRHGRVAVLGHERSRRGTPRVLGLTEGRDLVRLSADDFDETPLPVGQIELPVPYAPRNSAFRRDVADRLRRVRVQGGGRDGRQPDPETARISELEAQLAAHPVATDRERSARVDAAASADRLERDVARLERRVRGRSESLARQFDRVLRVLEAWGYVEDWSLTEWGSLLAHLYTETDLAVAESLREGLLDGLDGPELAALVSCFTFERRGPDGRGLLPPERWPTRELATRWRGIDRVARDLNHNEDDAGLPETRAPDPGFVPYAYEWVAGEDLVDLLADDDEMTGGDFVRHVKQCIDLLRQIGDVAPVPATAETARAAADACFRGVIAASSAVER
ncbi:MAG TPA: DEAD/DEAH box helicase [Acidimicrobiia bacterium]|nr:DEAD/DEAH box helicase [Acidimicrobiia bacterium]